MIKLTLPQLPYAYDALAPYISAKTMEIHHSKHHQAYVDNFNKALLGIKEPETSIEEILKTVSKYDVAIRNNGGGHFNHDFFWSSLTPGGSKPPTGILATLIDTYFDSLDSFQKDFREAALKRFGAGWAWLCLDKISRKLFITSTPNQDNPLMDVVPSAEHSIPLLGLDVWEHAYYLDYQNRRADYIDSFWHIVNWDVITYRLLHN